jgi:hypothetical protein
MFEHEQHDAWLLPKSPRYCAGRFGQTNPTDRSIASWQTDPTGDSVTHQPNEHNEPTDNDILPKQSQLLAQTKPIWKIQ